jgi:hypothetical protein
MLLAPTGVAAANPATASGQLNYVNMGDSYSAGSGILPPALGSDLRCARSSRSWAHDIARTHDYRLTDVSCGGATTADYTGSQYPGVRPQLDALSPATQLVTMTIGGNDNGVFAGVLADCGTAAALTLGLLGAIPLLAYVIPGFAQASVFGVRLPWLLLGVLPFPMMFVIGCWFHRITERHEREFLIMAEN